MSPIIIGLCGHKGCGKSTVAKYIMHTNDAASIVKFADSLKDMLRVVGLTEAQIEGPEKETPSALLQNKTPRLAMQTLGTEWGRDTLGENIWADIWANRVKNLSGIVLVDDVRFENEIERIEQLGGATFWLTRGSIYEGNDAHPSENSISADHCDFVIENTDSIQRAAQEILGLSWTNSFKREPN